MRYRDADGLRGPEGAFLACTFWLVECLARQGRRREATCTVPVVPAAAPTTWGCSPSSTHRAARQMLGNFPQGLTHLAHVNAALALRDGRTDQPPRGRAAAQPMTR